MSAALEIEDYAYQWPGGVKPVLNGIHLTLSPGECHCLTGPTGSGKSTLLLAIKGLLPKGSGRGIIRIHQNSEVWDPTVGLVLQNPETQILSPTVGDEVAFGLENLGFPPPEMPDRVRSALNAVGLKKPLSTPSRTLSMGEKYRLVLASVLVMEPRVVLLDEPAAQLDPEGLKDLKETIRKLKASGIAFLVVEHHPRVIDDIVDQYWFLDAKGTLQPSTLPEDKSSVAAASSLPPPLHPQGHPVIEADGVTLEHTPSHQLWKADLSLTGGQKISLYGPNGSGKTTLLRALTGFIKPRNGRLRVLSEIPEPRKLRGRIGCLFQNPEKQFFEETVLKEITFSIKRHRPREKNIETKIRKLLKRFGIDSLAEMSPHTLSFGQKHLVALAAILSHEPELALLDDPFVGLDPQNCRLALELIGHFNRQNGTTVIWAVHHQNGYPDWVDRQYAIQGGRIVSAP